MLPPINDMRMAHQIVEVATNGTITARTERIDPIITLTTTIEEILNEADPF